WRPRIQGEADAPVVQHDADGRDTEMRPEAGCVRLAQRDGGAVAVDRAQVDGAARPGRRDSVTGALTVHLRGPSVDGLAVEQRARFRAVVQPSWSVGARDACRFDE